MTDAPPEQAEVVAFLRGLASADPIETHISLVFLGADTVWKLKKAVRLPFLDFSAVDDRRRFTEREFALNSPAAPELYRDVVPIVRGRDGGLTLGGDGPAVDWVLRMARVPADDFLDAMAHAGRIDPPLLDRLADAVAAYHAGLPPLAGQLAALEPIARGNARAALAAGLPVERVTPWETAMLAALAGLRDWRAARAADGFVRRAHGDLHLGNLCLWSGAPTLFDALEFNEAMATIDLGYDLAFLLMDLDRRIGRAAANRVFNRYIARTGDVGMLPGLPHFLSMRAMIRAHVERKLGRSAVATEYLNAALDYPRPKRPVVVAIGGLPGTGKSTLGRMLAPLLGAAPGALMLRSDEIRKRRFGVAPEQRLPPDAYTAAVSETVFATLAEHARCAAAAGHAVIADATFMSTEHRAMIEAAADRAGVAFQGFWLTAPLSVLEARVAARRDDASDATVDVVRRAARANVAMAEGGRWIVLDATDGARAGDLAKAALAPHVA